jgi:hypothetical protein
MPVGRVARGMLSLAGIATAASTAAYLASRPRPPAVPDPHSARFAQLERRLTQLERGAPVRYRTAPVLAPAPRPDAGERGHKPYTVTHYEALANQVAHERQIAELKRRLAAIEGYPRA